MIQDIAPHKLYNQYDPTLQPDAEDLVLLFSGSKLVLKGGAFPKVSDFLPETKFTYLFCLDNIRFYLAAEESAFPVDGELVETSKLRRDTLLEQPFVFAAMTGKHLNDWYRDSRFCGRCGKAMTHSKKERAMCCTCGNTVYPRIMPAVIVGVKNGNKLLLTQYRTGYGHNALIAGFTEIGETAEETVAREVMEEAGIHVKNIRYYKTQPWGVANDLLIGYFCEVDGDDTIVMDTGELKVAHWVSRENIVLQPDNYSMTNEMMRMFKEGIER